LVHRAAPHGRAVAAQGLNGAVTLFVAAVTALIAPPIYGAFGSEITFGGIAVFMGLLALYAARHSKSIPEAASSS
jgi:hypothetical protein